MSSKLVGILANVLEWDAVATTARACERDYGGEEADRLGIFTPLMDFCYVWLRRLAGSGAEGFDRRPSTRSRQELTGNVTQERGLEHFTEGLSTVYTRMARALKPGAPLAFTYHHHKLDAYCAVGVAILDAGLVCSASLPCPAEMGGSIHIHGTSSSIIDTVFVCRSSGAMPESWLFDSPEGLVEIVGEDLVHLASTGRTPTYGDTRCIVLGHLTRMAAWVLRDTWDRSRPTAEKLASIRNRMMACGDPDQLARRVPLADPVADLPLFSRRTTVIRDEVHGAASLPGPRAFSRRGHLRAFGPLRAGCLRPRRKDTLPERTFTA